eukprot:tig00000658_g2903.t1
MFDPERIARMSLEGSLKCKAGTCANPESTPLCPDCFMKLGAKARKARAAPMCEELASPEADRVIMRWLQPLKNAEPARTIYNAVGAPLLTLLSKLIGPRCKDTLVSVDACSALQTLIMHHGAAAAAMNEPLLLPAVAEALRGGGSKLRYECMQALRMLALQTPDFPLRETLYPPAGGLLGAVVQQLSIGPERPAASPPPRYRSEGELQALCWGPLTPPELVKRYAPRMTAITHEVAAHTIYLKICKVASPIRRLRLRLARHPGLLPALLSLANKPFPRAYPEDESGFFAAASLRFLLFAPPFADSAPPAPAPEEEGGGGGAAARRPVPAGSEGRAAGVAAARGAHAALLAAAPDPAGEIAAGMLRALNEPLDARQNAVPGATAMCLHRDDGPEPEFIESAHASRRRQIEELAWCLAHLAAFPEGARAVLPHAPALREVADKGSEFVRKKALAGAESEALARGHLWEDVEEDVPTGAVGSAQGGALAALLRLRGAFPAQCPPLNEDAVAFSFFFFKLYVSLSLKPEDAFAFASFQADSIKQVGNAFFKMRDFVRASLFYSVALACCPVEHEGHVLRAAICGNIAEADIALGASSLSLSPRRPCAGRWAEEALVAAQRSLEEAEAAGEGEAAGAPAIINIAAKARSRAARARTLLGAGAPET